MLFEKINHEEKAGARNYILLLFTLYHDNMFLLAAEMLCIVNWALGHKTLRPVPSGSSLTHASQNTTSLSRAVRESDSHS